MIDLEAAAYLEVVWNKRRRRVLRGLVELETRNVRLAEGRGGLHSRQWRTMGRVGRAVTTTTR